MMKTKEPVLCPKPEKLVPSSLDIERLQLRLKKCWDQYPLTKVVRCLLESAKQN
jgi:hypothetical protein